MVLAVSGPRRVARPSSGRNVGDIERLFSAMGGGALALAGLRRKGAGGLMLATIGGALLHRGATGRCKVYEKLGISTASENGDAMTGRAATVNARQSVKVEHSVTIAVPRPELYDYWRHFENHPRFMRYVHFVLPMVDGRTRYDLRLPGGREISWISEIVRDIPGELISWKTVGTPDVAHAGSVNFRDTADSLGTTVTLAMDYEPIGGRTGHMFAKALGLAPEQMVQADLESFRRLMENRD